MSNHFRQSAYALLLLASVSRGAVVGMGGLEAVAISPDKKLVAIGGQNRVIYLVDAVTLAVQKRLWIAARIGALSFNKDGSRLIVEDENDRVRLLDTANGKEITRIDNVAGLVVSRSAGLIVLRDTLTDAKPRLRLLSLADLGDKGRIELPNRPAAYSFHASGKQLVVLGRSVPGDEKRVPPAEIPGELKGLAREAFRQQHDGYESHLRTFELATGKMLRDLKLWYTSDSESTILVPADKRTLVFNRANICASITCIAPGDAAHRQGKVMLFATAQRLNHGLGVSEDGRYLFTGGLAEGTHGPLQDGRRVRFEIDELPGQAELFTRFCVLADGSAYGVTTAYRLVKIARGKVEKVAAVY